jgi:hypothetical protein
MKSGTAKRAISHALYSCPIKVQMQVQVQMEELSSCPLSGHVEEEPKC